VKPAAAALLALLLLAGPSLADEDDTNPHRMAGPDDTSGCDFCHEEDMELSQPPLETCTVCHSIDEHAGAREHCQASAASVAALHPAKTDDEKKLPLTDGKMWCGTCHLFHDPQVNEEALLSQKWLPPTSGLPGAVRDAVAAGWDRLAKKHDQPPPVAKFAATGTEWLRLPVADGSLCLQCHQGVRK
jgi:hypothetical protein